MGLFWRGIMLAIRSVIEDLYRGEIDTKEAKVSFHRYCNQVGLNPFLAETFSEVMLTEEGKVELENYEKLVNQANWVMARVAAGVQSVESALGELGKAMKNVETRWMKDSRIATVESICRLFGQRN